MKRSEKIKVWIENHKEDVFLAAIVTGIGAMYAGLIYAAVKVDQNQRAENAAVRKMAMEAASRGATVLPGPEGLYWVLEYNK